MILFGAIQLGNAEDLDCVYEYYYFLKSYICNVTSFDNSNNDKIITGHTGNHKYGKEDVDVKMVHFRNIVVTYIPENIGSLFNLKGLILRDCNLIQLKTQDFIVMEQLEYMDLAGNKLSVLPAYVFTPLVQMNTIDLSYNQIEALPNSLFSNNLEIKRVYLIENKIKFIGSNVFDELSSFELLNLMGNVCVSKNYGNMNDLNTDMETKCNDPNN